MSDSIELTPSVDTTKPSSARMYDYMLGGKDNYESDRAAIDQVKQVAPYVEVAARANRAFMHRAVRELTELGLRQFLDIGTGIPTEPNLHQVAQAVAPETRVVYADNDPLVLAHARALLRGTPEGRTVFLNADARDPSGILAAPELAETFDLDSPIAVCLAAVLHFIGDEQDPYRIVRTLMDAAAPGSFLLLSHVTTDFNDPEVAKEALGRYSSSVVVRARTRDEVLRFFDGFELLEPGLVPTSRWRAAVESPKWQDEQVAFWAGVARKP